MFRMSYTTIVRAALATISLSQNHYQRGAKLTVDADGFYVEREPDVYARVRVCVCAGVGVRAWVCGGGGVCGGDRVWWWVWVWVYALACVWGGVCVRV